MARLGEGRPFEQWLAPADERGCRLFTGHRMKNGYGTLRRTGSREKVLAHRFAWERAFGPIPDGMWVLHRCDVRACCEPSHLFLGTAHDNNADMAAKGRHASNYGPWAPRRGITHLNPQGRA